MTWALIGLVVAALVTLARIYYLVKKRRGEHESDWDAKLVERLRTQGTDLFQPHDVDFFFALPSEAACQAVRSQLELDGFQVDTKPVPESTELSLHASKSIRLSIPGMREFSRRFSELARTHGGRYDGWAAGVVPMGGRPAAH
jgi:hypothetical protein